MKRSRYDACGTAELAFRFWSRLLEREWEVHVIARGFDPATEKILRIDEKHQTALRRWYRAGARLSRTGREITAFLRARRSHGHEPSARVRQ